MKKQILVAIPTLSSGGVEVSLIRFITELSKNKDLSIDLLLLEKTGMYLKDVPKNVHIIEVEYIDKMYCYNNKMSDIKNYKSILDKLKYLNIRLKLRNYVNKNNWEAYYKLILKYVKDINKEYDLAIDWHGYGHFISTIVADKVKAKKKAMWIHDEKNDWLIRVSYWLNSFDKLFCVSKACKASIDNNYASLKDKTSVFYNLLDYQNVRNKANEKIKTNYHDYELNLITVGRLEWQKGYDIAIDIAKKLKNASFKYHWYIIGGGTQEKALKALVNENGLANEITFLGVKPNPFPYIKNADFYIQPSRHEGYGLAIAEAKILGIVCIATNLDCIKEQITEGENGFLCELDATTFANKIINVSKDKKQITKIKNNLTKENFDYTNEFKKLYELMEE